MELQEFMKIVIEKLDEHSKILDSHTRILDEHTKILNEHTKILNRYEMQLKNHEDILFKLKRATLKIEDYVTNKIPALFDANLVNKEKSEVLEEKVEKLEQTISLHSIKISILEEANPK